MPGPEKTTEAPQGRVSTRRGLAAGMVDAFKAGYNQDQNYALDRPFIALSAAFREFLYRTQASRRRFLKGSAKVAGVGAVVAAEGLPVVDGLLGIAMEEKIGRRESPEIGWATGQKERLDTDESLDSMVICLPGTGIGKGNGNAELFLPQLQRIGAVGYVDYSTEGLKPKEIAEKILKIKEDYPKIKKFSIYGHSTGALVFGRVLEEMEKMGRGDDLKLDYMFMDCVPPDIRHLTEPALASLIALLNGEGTATFAAIENYILYGDPRAPHGTTPLLFADQLRIMWRGKEALQFVAAKAERDNARVISLRPMDASKDPFVDEDRSEGTIKEIFKNTRLRVINLEGNQGHANTDTNRKAYLKGIAQGIAA